MKSCRTNPTSKRPSPSLTRPGEGPQVYARTKAACSRAATTLVPVRHGLRRRRQPNVHSFFFVFHLCRHASAPGCLVAWSCTPAWPPAADMAWPTSCPCLALCHWIWITLSIDGAAFQHVSVCMWQRRDSNRSPHWPSARRASTTSHAGTRGKTHWDLGNRNAAVTDAVPQGGMALGLELGMELTRPVSN